MKAAHLLREISRRTPDRPALIDESTGRTRILTYGQLARQAGKAAARLYREGLRPGDVVLIAQPMSLELYVSLLGIFQLGLSAMFVDPGLLWRTFAQCCTAVPPQALIGGSMAQMLRLAMPALRPIRTSFATGIPFLGAVPWEDLKECLAEELPELHPPNEASLITFTSGCTGEPKVIVRTESFLIAQHHALERIMQPKPGQVSLSLLPAFVLTHLASGITSLIPRAQLLKSSISAASVAKLLAKYQPSTVISSPALFSAIVDLCEKCRERLPVKESIFLGGGPVFPEFLKRINRLAPELELNLVYGSSEAEPIAHLSYRDVSEADFFAMQNGSGLLAGKPVPEIECRIIRDTWGTPLSNLSEGDLDRLSTAKQTTGELLVSGPHVLTGYGNGRGDTETKVRTSNRIWHRTGDACSFDDAGRLWLLGRCDGKVIDEHGAIYPFSVEPVVEQVASIKRAALVHYQNTRVLLVHYQRRPTKAEKRLLESLLRPFAIARIIGCKLPLDSRHHAKINYQRLFSMGLSQRSEGKSRPGADNNTIGLGKEGGSRAYR